MLYQVLNPLYIIHIDLDYIIGVSVTRKRAQTAPVSAKSLFHFFATFLIRMLVIRIECPVTHATMHTPLAYTSRLFPFSL